MAWRRFEGLTETRRWLLLIFLVGWMHAGAYALLVPLWQAPDEPGHYEAACLLSQVKRPLTGDDLSLPLQRDILASLAQHEFWSQVHAPWPTPLPLAFVDDPFLARSGRQAGDEPPLYYLIPALICRTGLSIEGRLRLIRLFGALLFGLTGVVAAWGVRGEGRQVDWEPSRRDKETMKQEGKGNLSVHNAPPSALVSLLACLPLLILLLPMPAFIAGSANNDTLAMLTATAVFAAVLRAQRLGWTWRRGVGLILLLLLALASKKTNSFLLPWLTIISLALGWHWLRGRAWQPDAVAKIALGAMLVIIILLLPVNTPASWRTIGLPWAARRLDATAPRPPGAPESPVVIEIDRSRRGVIQAITGQSARALRGQAVETHAYVRSPDVLSTSGRLTVRDAAGFSQVEFVADNQWQSVAISRTIALTATRVKIAIAIGSVDDAEETGRLLVSHMGLFSRSDADTTTNLLRNGDFSRSARLGQPLVVAPLQDRWQRFAPRMQTGDEPAVEILKTYGLYSLLTFAGFWGNFGWLQRPLPLWVYAVLAAICMVAAAGVFRFWRRSSAEPSGTSRGIVGVWLLAVALVAGQVFLPMLGRPWQPQGRYLFTALLPIAGLLLVGSDAWLDFGRHPRRLVAVVGCEVVFAVYCLAVAAAA